MRSSKTDHILQKVRAVPTIFRLLHL